MKDSAQQGSGKVDHHFNDKVALSGFYLRQMTHEANTNYIRDNLFAAPSYSLDRVINALTINNTYVMNTSTVLTLRGG